MASTVKTAGENSSSEIVILGIETSCDETAAALVTSEGKILSNIVLSQFEAHQPYGGVVPEIAARSHVDHIDSVIKQAFSEASLTIDDVDAIAATAGPGLIGGVMVGVITAKALSMSAQKPFIAINHLEGHALSARLTEEINFPYLLLLISGGHCQLISVNGLDDYKRLGTTIDDAAGEAFDKTAKLLGLGVPGGPNLEKAALDGDETRFNFTQPLKGRPGCDFSFSGLKTAVRREAEKLSLKPDGLTKKDVSDLCASFQKTVTNSLKEKSKKAMDMFMDTFEGEGVSPSFVVAGGVAANGLIREALKSLSQENGFEFKAPPFGFVQIMQQ